MSKRIVEMSVSEFCDYVAANPGGARKAYEIRKEGGGDMGGGSERVVYKDKVVEKVIYRDKVREVKVPKEVVREVEVEKVIEKSSKFLRGSTVFFVLLSLVAIVAYGGKEVNPVSYVDREVSVEKVVEVPVEVVREVIKEVEVEVVREVNVVSDYLETTLRREIAARDEEIDRLIRQRGERSEAVSRMRFGR